MDTDQEHHLILSCGNFNPIWVSRVNVVWTVSLATATPSSPAPSLSLWGITPNVKTRFRCKIPDEYPAQGRVISHKTHREDVCVIQYWTSAFAILKHSRLAISECLWNNCSKLAYLHCLTNAHNRSMLTLLLFLAFLASVSELSARINFEM